MRCKGADPDNLAPGQLGSGTTRLWDNSAPIDDGLVYKPFLNIIALEYSRFVSGMGTSEHQRASGSTLFNNKGAF